LVNYLGQFAQQFLQDAGVRCRLEVPLSLPAVRLSAEIRHHVFLAFKEALNNVVKHARASEVRITLEMQERRISLGVEDNGQGFSWSEDGPIGEGAAPDGARTQNGLGNMRQRLREIGGQCVIQSALGQGTRVVFQVEHPTTSD
jgi:signal transduction histidine kinase